LAPASRGTVNDTSVIASVDLLPSIAKITGAPLPANTDFDGEDLSDTILGKARQTRTKPLLWVRPPDRPGNARVPFPDLAIRDGDWKLLIMEDGSRPQLYNLATDPRETTNLAGKQTEILARLKTKLLDWRKTLPIARPWPWNPKQIPATDKTPS
jgi:uncharacterized sulfatase